VNVDLTNRFLYFIDAEDKGGSKSIIDDRGMSTHKLRSYTFTRTMLKENTFLDSMEHEEDNSIKSKIMTAILTNEYNRQKSLIKDFDFTIMP
jgi:hypothetical protein